MNKKLSQRLILGFGAATVFLMLGFPPFQRRFDGEVINCGYAFIFQPSCDGQGSVNGYLLLVQWTGVVIFCLLAFFGFGLANSATSDQKQDAVARKGQPVRSRDIWQSATKRAREIVIALYLYVAALSTILALGAFGGLIVGIANSDYSAVTVSAVAAAFSSWMVYWCWKRSNLRDNTSASAQKSKAGASAPGDEMRIYMQLHNEFEAFKKSHAERPEAAPVGGLDKASSVGGMVRNRLKAGDKTFQDVANSIHDRDPSVGPDNIVKAWNRVRKADVSRNLPEAGDAIQAILERYKASLLERIDELQRQIDSGVRNPPKGKTPMQLDKEAGSVKAHCDELNREYQQIFFSMDLTDEQRFERITMRKSIEKRMIDAMPW